MSQISIGYKKAVAIPLLLCGLVFLGIQMAIGISPVIIIMILLIIWGWVMLTAPVAVITKETVQIKNMYGITIKTIPYTAGEIEVKPEGIIVKGKKVVSSALAEYHPDQIKSFLQS